MRRGEMADAPMSERTVVSQQTCRQISSLGSLGSW